MRLGRSYCYVSSTPFYHLLSLTNVSIIVPAPPLFRALWVVKPGAGHPWAVSRAGGGRAAPRSGRWAAGPPAWTGDRERPGERAGPDRAAQCCHVFSRRQVGLPNAHPLHRRNVTSSHAAGKTRPPTAPPVLERSLPRLHTQRPAANAPRRAAASSRALSALRLRAAGVARKAWGTPI